MVHLHYYSTTHWGYQPWPQAVDSRILWHRQKHHIKSKYSFVHFVHERSVVPLAGNNLHNKTKYKSGSKGNGSKQN